MPASMKDRYLLNKGDFYIANEDCTACGAPQAEAPDIIEHAKVDGHCYFKKQPQTEDELDQVVKAMMKATTMMRNWTLIPDPKGNIQIYRKFWKDPNWDQQHLAPPLLIYADLVVTGDSRNLNTASLIHHQYLENEPE